MKLSRRLLLVMTALALPTAGVCLVSAQDQGGAGASPDARKALMAKWHDHQQKIRAEALKTDPTLAPTYARLDAWKQQHVKPTTSG